MTRLLQPFFARIASATDSKLAQMVEYLKAENAILRAKLPTRVTVTAQEKARLVKLGTALGGALKNLITIVSPRTFARWVAGSETTGGKPKPVSVRKPDRPRTAEALRKLVIKLATENEWGTSLTHGRSHRYPRSRLPALSPRTVGCRAAVGAHVPPSADRSPPARELLRCAAGIQDAFPLVG